jgi:hypothetical protein
MTHFPTWASTACVGLLIGLGSACAPETGALTPPPLRIQQHGAPQADTAPAGADAEYAKGFKAGYTDAIRAQRATAERDDFLKLRVKYGDGYMPPAAAVAGSEAAASPCQGVTSAHAGNCKP